MKKEEVLRLVDSIHRDKSIPRETLFRALESAIAQAAQKVFGSELEDIKVFVDRTSGSISVKVEEEDVALNDGQLGRIAAQTAKQTLASKIREAERDMIIEEFSDKIRTIVTAEVQRMEKGSVIVTVHGVEASIPREEQVPTERYRTGDRLRCFILGLNTRSTRATLVLSRARPELVHELFISDVPEIAEGRIVVQELAREPGFRTKIAVHCDDERIDCVGACVGPRGTRIRNIINELGGEKIDIIRWSPIPETFIANSLAPARISRVYLDPEERDAIVVVPDDQLSLAIGRKGQNVRLTCRLTRWNVDVKSEAEFETERKQELEGHEGSVLLGEEEGETSEGPTPSETPSTEAPTLDASSMEPQEDDSLGESLLSSTPTNQSDN